MRPASALRAAIAITLIIGCSDSTTVPTPSEQPAPVRDENQILVERVLQTLAPGDRAGAVIGILEEGRTDRAATVSVTIPQQRTRYRRMEKSFRGWIGIDEVVGEGQSVTYSQPIARLTGPAGTENLYHTPPLQYANYYGNVGPGAYEFGEWLGNWTLAANDTLWYAHYDFSGWSYWYAPCANQGGFWGDSLVHTWDLRRGSCKATTVYVKYAIRPITVCPPPASFSFSGTTNLNEAPYTFSANTSSAACGGMTYSWYMNSYGAIHGGGYICTNLATCSFPTNGGLPFLLSVTATKTFANGATYSASHSWSVTVPLAANLSGPDQVDALALMNWNAGGSGGVGPYSYAWYYDDALQPDNGTSFQVMLPEGVHDISVRVTDGRSVTVEEGLTVESVDPNGGGGGCEPNCELRASKTPESKVRKPAARTGVPVTKPQPANTKRTPQKP